MPETAIDHAARAENLRAVIENHCHKLNDESLNDAVAEGPPETLSVPHRYVAPTYDGSGTWLEFADTLAEMAVDLAGEICGEVPWAPGSVFDLDTGESYATEVSVRIVGAPDAPAPCTICGAGEADGCKVEPRRAIECPR